MFKTINTKLFYNIALLTPINNLINWKLWTSISKILSCRFWKRFFQFFCGLDGQIRPHVQKFER